MDAQKKPEVDLQMLDEQQKSIKGVKSADPVEKKAGKIKLYLQINEKNGKRMRPLHPRTKLPIVGKEVILYPDKPTEVSTEIAEILLEQDPKFVSLKPYDPEKDPMIQVLKMRQSRLDRSKKMQEKEMREREKANLKFKRIKEEQGVMAAAYQEELRKKKEEKEKVVAKTKDSDSDDYIALYTPSLSELAERKLEEMKPSEFKEYAGRLGFKLNGRTKAGWILQMEKRCDELSLKIQEQMKSKG